MSKDNLEPGDIVKRSQELGLVMRNDEDSGLLVAYPGMDELTIARESDVQFVTNIENIITDEP
jgi:hypothetical protein